MNALNFIEQALSDASAGIHLSADTTQKVIEQMLNGQVSREQMTDLLASLRSKGEAVSELCGAAQALRSAMVPIRTTRTGLVDTCGTGGDGLKTFNISTAAALVVAATGTPVAKHGNRRVTSATGSADVLAELGINVEAPREVVETCLTELGICFCYAPLLHPAMRKVAEARRWLAGPSLFNYLGPLCNPASATFQVIGTGTRTIQQLLAESLVHLQTERAIVVRGRDGLDEVTLADVTDVLEIQDQEIMSHQWSPLDFGLPRSSTTELFAEGPAQSAAMIRHVLEGGTGPCRDIVLANAAASLWVAKQERDLSQAVKICAAAIDAGHAKRLLHDLGIRTTTQELA